MLDDFSEPALKDLKKLKNEHRRLFQAERVKLLEVLDSLDNKRTTKDLPKKFRVKKLKYSEGLWAMTWSFSGPDGRAIFYFEESENETRLIWVRIGDHGIFKQP